MVLKSRTSQEISIAPLPVQCKLLFTCLPVDVFWGLYSLLSWPIVNNEVVYRHKGPLNWLSEQKLTLFVLVFVLFSKQVLITINV